VSVSIEDVAAGRVGFANVVDPGRAARLAPLHPGEVVRDEFLEPLGMSAYALAKAPARPTQPDYRDLGRRARDQRRHCASLGPVLRHDAGILDQLAGRPRPPSLAS
jgi:CubicO group peptidase (beta-lactamase class C family)